MAVKLRSKRKPYDPFEAGRRVGLIRQTMKMPQIPFAKSIGCGQTSISVIESGDSKMGIDIILEICRVHKINSNWLLFGAGSMFQTKGDSVDELTEAREEIGRLTDELAGTKKIISEFLKRK